MQYLTDWIQTEQIAHIKQFIGNAMMAIRPNPLGELTNGELIHRFRFDRAGIEFLEELLVDRISPPTARSNSLTAREKLLITLRFLATGGIQLNDGDIHKVTQPTVSRAIAQVTEELSSQEILRRYIYFPTTTEDCKKQTQQFFGVSRFPNVVGVIDGTHIRIKAPSENEEVFVNRKGYHSVNVQVVFNAFDQLIDIVARWPGSAHDSRILQQSGVQQLFEGGHMPNGQHYLLGDSGYACKRWLLTPYANPQPGPQSHYNRAHKRTRAKVERGIGQLKRRFGVLHGEVRMKPDKVCRIVLSCAVLHNICKLRQIPLPDDIDVDDGDNVDRDDDRDDDEGPQIGLRYRDFITSTYF